MQDFHAFCEDLQYREHVQEDFMWTGARESRVHPGCIMRRVREDDVELPLPGAEERPLPVIVERRIAQNGSDIATFASFDTLGDAPDENDEPSIDSSVTESRDWPYENNEFQQPSRERSRGHLVNVGATDAMVVTVEEAPYFVGS
jgi:hypothetical protein